MVQLERRRLLIGGKPRLLISGELQYFRLARKDWQTRIRQAKEGGLNAITSYIPWIFHEEIEGDIDVTGRKRPERDLGAFIDLCHEAGLWFIARPGPYVMAECKNEGLPYWIFQKPDVVPETWNGKKVSSKNLELLSPAFLEAAKRWYGGVMPVLASRLESNGGPVVAVQLCNEIGMLMYWTNEPVLNEETQCEVAAFAQHRLGAHEANERYGVDLGDPSARRIAFWSGEFAGSATFRKDYSEVMRDRFARYISQLRTFAEENGVRDVPFVINIHGTSDDHARFYPVGISQTMRCFNQAPGYLPSSDQYLGELTRSNASDEIFLSLFTQSVCRPEQPISSIEFQSGTSDYNDDGSTRISGASIDFKARLSVLLGNRMISHYTFAAGFNPKLERDYQDGNDTIGTGGETHDGSSSPIDLDGKLDPVYHEIKDSNETLLAVGDLLADMEPELDNVRIGFIPDYWATELRREKGPLGPFTRELEESRARLDGFMRPLLDRCFGLAAVDLQQEIPASTQVIALACSRYLDGQVQERLVRFVKSGGRLLIYGRIPTMNMEGAPATHLIDALGVKAKTPVSSEGKYLGLEGVGWAAGKPEEATWMVQPFEADRGEPFFRTFQYRDVCASTIPLGEGKVALIACEPRGHKWIWDGVFDRLGAKSAFSHNYAHGGLLVNRVIDPPGQRFVSLINLDLLDKTFTLREHGNELFGGPLHLGPRKAKLLPLGVKVGHVDFSWSTAEIVRSSPRSVWLRESGAFERALIRGPIRVVGDSVKAEPVAGGTLLEISPGSGRVHIESLG